MLAGKAKPRGFEKRASEPKGENQNGLGVGEEPFKNMIGRCWPERLSQGEAKKIVIGPESPKEICRGIG